MGLTKKYILFPGVFLLLSLHCWVVLNPLKQLSLRRGSILYSNSVCFTNDSPILNSGPDNHRGNQTSACSDSNGTASY